MVPNNVNGILGLAPQTSKDTPSVVTALHKAKLIDTPIATLWMNSDGDSPTLFVMGDVLANQTAADYTHHKNMNHGKNPMWQLPLEKFFINGKEQKTAVTRSAFVDPTSTMSVPYQDWELYKAAFLAASSDF